MVKKTITYKDFDGQERTEDYYFNLTKTELTEMELSMNGGLSTLLAKIIKEHDMKQMIEYFKRIVLDSYGEKSLDGRMFVKNDKIKENFKSTMAYSEIFMELANDDKAAADFINGILPSDLAEEVQKQEAKAGPVLAPVPHN